MSTLEHTSLRDARVAAAAGDVQVRGRRPAEDVAPRRVCVRGSERGRAKACFSGMKLITKNMPGNMINVQQFNHTHGRPSDVWKKIHSEGTDRYIERYEWFRYTTKGTFRHSVQYDLGYLQV